MENHLNVKTLSFYAVMIGSVVTLFKVVSAYGESNLKAPPNLSGTYSIRSENLPECLKSKNLNLTIEQSGVYVDGNLSPSTDNKNSNKHKGGKIHLQGKMKEAEISLSGTTKNFDICPQLAANSLQNPIAIQASPQGKDLVGKITWNAANSPTNFTAQLQKTDKQESEKH